MNLNIIEAKKPVNRHRVAIVLSKYNGYIGERLLEACLVSLEEGGINKDSVTLVKVPGAYELPVTVANLVRQDKYSAIITLGAIIRGETPHFDIIANSCSQAISRIAVDSGVPVIFGVLTVNTSEQAMDRSGEPDSNKGTEAAVAALEMIALMEKLGDE